MTEPDGVDTEQLPDGMWVWTYQSPGGAYHQGPLHHKTKAAARKAGNTWLANQPPVRMP